MKERRSARQTTSLAGQLLLASPALREATFRRTVILLSAHDGDGAMGVVLNRPLGKQLAELNTEFAFGPLAAVPLYAGGPVQPAQLVFVAWQWLKAEGAFQLQFGLEPEKAAGLVGTPGVVLRAFLGYAGWGKGQLENEMKHDTWFITTVDGAQLEETDGVGLWRNLLGSVDPDLRLLANEPEDPTVN